MDPAGIAEETPFATERRISMWRAFREFISDLRFTWKNLKAECSSAWLSIHSGTIWCCLLLIINIFYWLFGGLLFASLEGKYGYSISLLIPALFEFVAKSIT